MKKDKITYIIVSIALTVVVAVSGICIAQSSQKKAADTGNSVASSNTQVDSNPDSLEPAASPDSAESANDGLPQPPSDALSASANTGDSDTSNSGAADSINTISNNSTGENTSNSNGTVSSSDKSSSTSSSDDKKSTTDSGKNSSSSSSKNTTASSNAGNSSPSSKNTTASSNAGNSSSSGTSGTSSSDNSSAGSNGGQNSNGNSNNSNGNSSTSDNPQKTITLNKTSIKSTGSGIQISGTDVTITEAGTYTVSGSLNDGRILVNTAKTNDVELVLNKVSITCSNQAPVYVQSANSVTLNLQAGTTNTISDGSKYTFSSASVTEPNAAIFSEDDLKIKGSGTLTVTGSYADGIATKNDLIISEGNVNVIAHDDGLRGKDSVRIKGGNVSVTSEGHGVKVTNGTESSKGYLLVEKGSLSIDSEKDGVHATQLVNVTGGTLNVKAGNEAMDVDKDITITGGTVLLAASKGVNHGAIAYGGSCTVNNGTLFAVGNSTPAKDISSSSPQPSMLYKGSMDLPKNSSIEIKDASGKAVAKFAARKQFQSVLVSIPELSKGKTYTLYINGTKVM